MKTFNYSIGMFGTSIPINLLKTFAFVYYVDTLGVTTGQWATIMLIYTFIDAADNLVYGYLSDRTRTKWGRRRPWLVIGTPLLVLGLILFYTTPSGLSALRSTPSRTVLWPRACAIKSPWCWPVPSATTAPCPA